MEDYIEFGELNETEVIAARDELMLQQDGQVKRIAVQNFNQLSDQKVTGAEARLQSKIDTVSEGLADVVKIIPMQASEENQLADKDFVNSTVGTNTANYISDDGQPFASLEDLEAYTGAVTNNDYAFVTGTDENGNVYFDRYKATRDGMTVSWAKEYRLNNSSFTAAQWAAIQSGVTAEKVAQYDAGATPEGIIDLIYPIGFIITTEDKNFDPNTKWPWTTWEIKAKGRVLQGATDDQNGGETIEPALPNIKGTYSDNSGESTAVGTGAFKNSRALSGQSIWLGSPQTGTMGVQDFNAHNSNEIYKDNCNTVQPPAIAVYFWKRTA